MAAARAALGRLGEWTPEWDDRPPADLIVATGGAWAVAPAPTVALALVDVLRRPGAGQFALDHARILAPLGSIPDADERRAMVADLVDDLLAPLGTVVTPAGMRAGRSAGSLVLHGGRRLDAARPDAGRARARRPAARDARPSPSSRSATRSASGRAGRHFAIDVTGGLGGLVVDLRDVPLQLPGSGRPARRAARVVADGDRDREARCERRRRPARARPAADRSRRSTPCSRSRRATGRWSRPAIRSCVGAPIAERLRDPAARRGRDPGRRRCRIPAGAGSACRDAATSRDPGGEHVFDWHGRWRVATGDITDAVESPFAGIVRDGPARDRHHDPGRGPRDPRHRRPRRTDARPAPGRAPTGELRSGGLDVGSAGTILVVGSRVDAETLTRARAMGVCGVVVAGLSSKERRDFLASEARQRAALHRLPPFAVLVLDGATRRPLAGAVQAVLGALAGREVAIVTDPPMLVFDLPNLDHPGRRPSTSSASGPGRWPGARAASSGRSGRAGSPVASTSRPASSASPTAPTAAVRSATSNGSSDGRLSATLGPR